MLGFVPENELGKSFRIASSISWMVNVPLKLRDEHIPYKK